MVGSATGWRKNALVVIAAWTVVVVFASSILALAPGGLGFGAGSSRAWVLATRIAATDWYTWALLTPAVLWLSRRYPVDARSARVALPLHIAFAVAVTVAHSVLHIAIDTGAAQLTGETLDAAGHLRWLLTTQALLNALVYAAVAGVGHALHYYRQSRARELRAARLEVGLSQARLSALRQQLRPHFLFNALNSISSLVYDAPDRADSALARLGDLLRMTLRADSDQLSLEGDAELARAYVAVERLRFEDRFQCTFAIEPGLAAAMVPAMLLQPLLENAVHHGLARSDGPGRVEVAAGLCGAHRLRITVDDNGPRASPISDCVRAGVGLTNLRERLEALHPGATRCALESSHLGGTRAVVELPLVWPVA